VLANIQAYLIVVQEGSLHRAAKRLNLSQSALSRQMQKLEHELGGPLLERMTTGIRPTAAGRALVSKMAAVISNYETALVEVRRNIRGTTDQLRVGYLNSAARDYLYPALAKFRKEFPAAKLRLLDLSPGEMLKGLREGELDLAMTHVGAEILSVDFYVRRITKLPGVVALSEDHPLSGRAELKLADLKGSVFVKSPESDMPGHNQRLERYCRKFGGFKPRFIGRPQSLAEGLNLVANDDAVAILPQISKNLSPLGVNIIPLTDKGISWELVLVWKRGPLDRSLRALLDAFSKASKG
jgi:DNA-binding transcriptional LysR family regulator